MPSSVVLMILVAQPYFDEENYEISLLLYYFYLCLIYGIESWVHTLGQTLKQRELKTTTISATQGFHVSGCKFHKAKNKRGDPYCAMAYIILCTRYVAGLETCTQPIPLMAKPVGGYLTALPTRREVGTESYCRVVSTLALGNLAAPRL